MRIVFVCRQLSPRYGMESALLVLAQTLAEKATVDILVLGGASVGNDGAGVHSVRVLSGSRSSIRQQVEPEFVDGSAMIVAVGLWTLRYIPRKHWKDIFLWEHSLTTRRLWTSFRFFGLYLLTLGAHWKSRGVIAVSHEVELAVRHWAHAKRVVQISNAMPEIPARGSSPRYCSCPLKHVAFVGRLTPVKNPELALKAVHDVPNLHLLIFGDGVLRETLTKQATASGVVANVELMGFVSAPLLMAPEIDMLIVTSESETFCLSALEALSAGIPVLSVPLPAIRQFQTEGLEVTISASRRLKDVQAAMLSVLRRKQVPGIERPKLPLHRSTEFIANSWSDFLSKSA